FIDGQDPVVAGLAQRLYRCGVRRLRRARLAQSSAGKHAGCISDRGAVSVMAHGSADRCGVAAAALAREPAVQDLRSTVRGGYSVVLRQPVPDDARWFAAGYCHTDRRGVFSRGLGVLWVGGLAVAVSALEVPQQ